MLAVFVGEVAVGAEHVVVKNGGCRDGRAIVREGEERILPNDHAPVFPGRLVIAGREENGRWNNQVLTKDEPPGYDEPR